MSLARPPAGSAEGIGLATHEVYYNNDQVGSGRLQYSNQAEFKTATVSVYGSSAGPSSVSRSYSALGQGDYSSFGVLYEAQSESAAIPVDATMYTYVMYMRLLRTQTGWRQIYRVGTPNWWNRSPGMWMRYRNDGWMRGTQWWGNWYDGTKLHLQMNYVTSSGSETSRASADVYRGLTFGRWTQIALVLDDKHWSSYADSYPQMVTQFPGTPNTYEDYDLTVLRWSGSWCPEVNISSMRSVTT